MEKLPLLPVASTSVSLISSYDKSLTSCFVSRGMGFHIVQQLASHGAKVYMAARSEAAAREAIQRIGAEKPELQGKDRVVYLKLDLSTLKSAQDSANEYLQLERRLDIIGRFSPFQIVVHT